MVKNIQATTWITPPSNLKQQW